MTNWKTSMYAQIAYMAGMGLPFLFAPNLMLPILGLEPTQEIWIRILGMLVLTLVVYYTLSVRRNNLEFARASVLGRLVFCLGLTVLALVYDTYIFILFAILEAGLAIWTRRTLPAGQAKG